VEIVDDPVNRGDAYSALIHGFRGGAVQYPFAMALAQELEEGLGLRVEAIPDDTIILILIPRTAGDDPELLIRRAIRCLGEGDRGERYFRERLESSGIFGAAFREAAERSLLLPRAGFGKRSPLWITRMSMTSGRNFGGCPWGTRPSRMPWGKTPPEKGDPPGRPCPPW
jgi:ATP-dependent Lhr-like helicase